MYMAVMVDAANVSIKMYIVIVSLFLTTNEEIRSNNLIARFLRGLEGTGGAPAEGRRVGSVICPPKRFAARYADIVLKFLHI